MRRSIAGVNIFIKFPKIFAKPINPYLSAKEKKKVNFLCSCRIILISGFKNKIVYLPVFSTFPIFVK